MKFRMSLLGGLVLVAALAGAESPSPEEQGAALLKPYKANLRLALMMAMPKGPEAAIEICSEMAPELAEVFSNDDVTMGRSSHKLRNPDNAMPEWVGYLVEPVVKDLGDGRYGYAEPIFVEKPCLTCHGANIDSGIAEKIRSMYPEDQATGYKEGDMRGVFWVEFRGDGNLRGR